MEAMNQPLVVANNPNAPAHVVPQQQQAAQPQQPLPPNSRAFSLTSCLKQCLERCCGWGVFKPRPAANPHNVANQANNADESYYLLPCELSVGTLDTLHQIGGAVTATFPPLCIWIFNSLIAEGMGLDQDSTAHDWGMVIAASGGSLVSFVGLYWLMFNRQYMWKTAKWAFTILLTPTGMMLFEAIGDQVWFDHDDPSAEHLRKNERAWFYVFAFFFGGLGVSPHICFCKKNREDIDANKQGVIELRGQLGQKVDQQAINHLNNQLNQKADQATVNLKANQTTVDDKADRQEVNQLKDKVNGLEQSLDGAYILDISSHSLLSLSSSPRLDYGSSGHDNPLSSRYTKSKSLSSHSTMSLKSPKSEDDIKSNDDVSNDINLQSPLASKPKSVASQSQSQLVQVNKKQLSLLIHKLAEQQVQQQTKQMVQFYQNQLVEKDQRYDQLQGELSAYKQKLNEHKQELDDTKHKLNEYSKTMEQNSIEMNKKLDNLSNLFPEPSANNSATKNIMQSHDDISHINDDMKTSKIQVNDKQNALSQIPQQSSLIDNDGDV